MPKKRAVARSTRSIFLPCAFDRARTCAQRRAWPRRRTLAQAQAVTDDLFAQVIGRAIADLAAWPAGDRPGAAGGMLPLSNKNT